MRNIWTKLGVSAATCLAALSLTTTAFAADASNSNTGADSHNDASVNIDNNINISSINNAVINNNISVSANTGNNSASQNTGNGVISTGNITGSIIIENIGNSNELFNSQLDLHRGRDCDFAASNSQTGADSHNNSSVHVNNNVNLTVLNDADITNNVGADLNTGGNSADENTGDGLITTGDIDFSVLVKNEFNTNQIGLPIPEVPTPQPPPAIIPTPTQVGRVLAAAAGALPVTGSNLPSWPILLVVLGFTLKLLEKVFKVCFDEAA